MPTYVEPTQASVQANARLADNLESIVDASNITLQNEPYYVQPQAQSAGANESQAIVGQNEYEQRLARFEQQMKVLEQSKEFGAPAASGLAGSRTQVAPAPIDPATRTSAVRSLIASDQPRTYGRTPEDYERLLNAGQGGSDVMKAAAQEFGEPLRGSNVRTARAVPTQDPFNDGFRTPTSVPAPRQLPARGVSIMNEPEGRTAPRTAPRRSPYSRWQEEEDDPIARETGQLPEPNIVEDPDNPIREGQDRELDDLRKELDQIENQDGTDEEDPLDPDDIPDIEDPVDDEPDEVIPQAFRKSCDEFRTELLNSSIRDISLDISPPIATTGESYVAISRSWTDRNGNILATGTMTDLRRGYVILDTGQKIAYARLSDADLAAVSSAWRIPAECTLGNQPFNGRNWVPSTFQWTASNLCHKPLYFENVQLERYGHSAGPIAQPFRSANHFFASLLLLPNQVATTAPTECQYALGYYRPGNCAPWLVNEMSYSMNGLRAQAFFLTGAAFIP